MCTNFFVLFRRIKTIDICSKFIVFLQEEKDTIDNCTNFIVFLQEEKEAADMCNNFIISFRRMRLLTCVLIS